jgi:hypothetical protein
MKKIAKMQTSNGNFIDLNAAIERADLLRRQNSKEMIQRFVSRASELEIGLAIDQKIKSFARGLVKSFVAMRNRKV